MHTQTCTPAHVTYVCIVAPRHLLFNLMLEIPSHSFLFFSAWPHPFGECTKNTGEGRGTNSKEQTVTRQQAATAQKTLQVSGDGSGWPG